MPLPVISNVYRAAFTWTNTDTGFSAVNVMHFKKSGSNPAALATSLAGAVHQDMWAFQGSHSHIREVDITPLDGAGVTYPYITGSGTVWSGSDGSNDHNPQVANIIKIVTAKRGRSYRGRVFLPWVCENLQANGVLDSGTLATVQAKWVAFATTMTGDGWDQVVASYLHATSEEVIGYLAERQTATQRRRQKRTSA